MCCGRYSVAGYMGAFGSLTWSSLFSATISPALFDFPDYKQQQKENGRTKSRQREKKWKGEREERESVCIFYSSRERQRQWKMEMEEVEVHVLRKECEGFVYFFLLLLF